MENKRIEKLMSVLIGVAAFMILMGALFELQHYPYGNEISSAGVVLYITVTSIEISRLKKVLRKSRRGEIKEG